MNTPKRAGSEGKQISTDRLSLCKIPRSVGSSISALTFRVRDHLPISGSSDCERESSFQIRLIEAGKGHAGIHRNEERVDVLAAIVLVFILSKSLSGWRNRRDEVEGNVVFSSSEFFFGQQNVSILALNRSFCVIYSQVARNALTIVEQKRSRRLQFERKFLVSGGCSCMSHEREGKTIANVGYETCAFSRQFPRNPARGGREARNGKKKNKRDQGCAAHSRAV